MRLPFVCLVSIPILFAQAADEKEHLRNGIHALLPKALFKK